jgi:hypothetical protein
MEWFLFLITDSLQYCSGGQEQNLAMHLIGDELVNMQVPIEQQLQLQARMKTVRIFSDRIRDRIRLEEF